MGLQCQSSDTLSSAALNIFVCCFYTKYFKNTFDTDSSTLSVINNSAHRYTTAYSPITLAEETAWTLYPIATILTFLLKTSSILCLAVSHCIFENRGFRQIQSISSTVDARECLPLHFPLYRLQIV